MENSTQNREPGGGYQQEKVGQNPIERRAELRRVLFISYSFPPSIEMGAITCGQIARYLPMYGWHPVVLTIKEEYFEEGHLNREGDAPPHAYTDTIVRTSMLPHPLDIYRWFKSNSLVKNVSSADKQPAKEAIVNTHTSNGWSRFRDLMLAVLSIPDIYTGWLIPAVINGLRTIRQTNTWAIFSSAPYFTPHLVGYAISQLTGLPWMAHFRDPWITGRVPEYAIDGFSFRVNRKLERITVERANAVVCVTEEHAALMRSAYPQMPASKFTAVMNGFDGAEWEELAEAFARNTQIYDDRPRKFRIAYAGTIYLGRDPTPLFCALRALIDAGEMRKEELAIELMGRCETVGRNQSISSFISEAGLDGCVQRVGTLDHSETLRRLSQSDLLLLLAEIWTIQIPGKTYEYLKTGRPILALTHEGALANLLRQTGGGWVVDPQDQAGIISALRECYQSWKQGLPGRAPDPVIVESFDRRRTTRRIAELLDSFTK